MQNFILSKLYPFLISIRLSVVLLLLITGDLCFGYVLLHGNGSFYEPMNEIGLLPWLQTYGLANPFLSSWFFILIGLLFCLVVNTLLCTLDKLYHLFISWGNGRSRKNSKLILCIHLMHVAMVVLLVGYFMSYTTATIHNSLTLRPGGKLIIPNTNIAAELNSLHLVPYPGTRNDSYVGRFIDVSAQLTFSTPGKNEITTLSMNNPVTFAGHSIFLQRFNPRKKGGMSAKKYIIIDVRKDYGIPLVFSGMSIFILGFFGYIILRSPLRLTRRTAS